MGRDERDERDEVQYTSYTPDLSSCYTRTSPLAKGEVTDFLT
ncbi:MAG: hypothetical protein P8075_11090 [Deltaproteobacteria bacterium]|jgi:hypothetical protein